ncbi:hypothetical protein AQUCO_01200202v1 [Aquilegia coerulea]|uniref:NB-ARC domain-containing protein n=1 Tax=Aquilegia coerulea TaxID=218851 RepID=A0A2G5E4Y2_AQUCA|nr:hypothetical protein AQUCO_01200202v1 [Aquilegia coerulea]ULP54372.1 ZAR1-sis [Aquilegia coerulea]
MDPITTVLIEFLAKELLNVLEDKAKSVFGFWGEFDKMKRKLEYISSFRTDLEENHRDYSIVKKILPQLRELIYEADDIVADCRIRLDYEEVRKLYGNFFSNFHKSNPRGLLFRTNAKIMLSNVNNRIEEMENELLKTYLPSLPNKTCQTDSQEVSARLRRNSHFRKQKPIGLQNDARNIIEWIKENKKSCRIGILGMGGLGKTTIAREIYNAEEVLDYFTVRIWVTVSQEFTDKDIFTSILKQLGIREFETDNSEMLTKICQFLNDKKYLIVMDDVWRIDYDYWRQVFNDLRGGDNCTKCIIITTRNRTVIDNLGVTRTHEPRMLDEDESLCLFREVAFPDDRNFSSHPEFQTVGEDIVIKCRGLPLAIKTIAGLLSTKPLSLEKWKEVSENFHDGLEAVEESLRLSYDDLSPMLKHCILSFSIYPEDAEIDADQLLYWWVGEGFVHGKARKTALEVASLCLLELVNRCMVDVVDQRCYDGRVYICKMHDMVRNLIIQKSKDEAFSSFDENDKHRADEYARHLGYTNDMDEMLPKLSSKLRAFLLMKKCLFQFSQITVARLSLLKSLRVLDLSSNELENITVEDLLKLIKSQKRLAYLSLRRIGGLKELPDWIKKRQNLQILVIKECKNLKTLPPSITTLRNLVVLDVEKCPLCNLPEGLGRLAKLQVLAGFKLARPGDNGARLGELTGLKELKELRISLSQSDEIADNEADALSKLDQLKVLSIDTKDCTEKQVLLVNKFSPPRSLRELFLRSYVGDTTPDWLSPVCLPDLVYLYVDLSRQLRRVSTSFWGANENTWRIEGLCFKHLYKFDLSWQDLMTKMKLRYVEASNCHAFKGFPFDVSGSGYWSSC